LTCFADFISRGYIGESELNINNIGKEKSMELLQNEKRMILETWEFAIGVIFLD